MIKIKYFILLIGLYLLSHSNYAQSTLLWADSILTKIRGEHEKRIYVSNPNSDTLVYIYLVHGETCKSIEILLLSIDHYRNTSDFKKALSNAILANQIASKNLCKQSKLSSEIDWAFAKIYVSLNDTKKAKQYIEKAIQEWQESNPKKETLIRLYLLKGALSESTEEELKNYKLAHQLSLKYKDVKMEEISLHSLGSFYAVNNQYELATKLIKSSLTYAHARNAYGTLSSLYNNLAGLSEDPKTISKYIDSAIYYAEKSGDLEDLQTSKQNKAYHLYNTKKYEEAYNSLWESTELKDSIININKIKVAAEMSEKFETEKKQNTIIKLQKENEISLLKSANKQTIITGLFIALVAFIFISVAFYTQKQNKQKLNNELSIEKIKSDELLRNILPAEIAEELKWNGKSEAKLYNQVSVLFTDFVNFTGISEQMSPTELVREIHSYFTAFDTIMERNGVEKIKTIGDAYLAVCGLPNENPNHAKHIINAALEIQKYMRENNSKFQIRIGIHSGPVVAGIVGVKKYAYDIWGDTVNTAARMEQNSLPGKINVSGATYNLIKDYFPCQYRGKINVKNKGEIDMYFV